LKRMQDLLHRILAKHTGQSLERIADDFDRDHFMAPEEAVEYGLIDEILAAPEVAEDGKEPKEKKEKKEKKGDSVKAES
jgi:ATP-dependent Clp protease protease subunit